MIKQKQAYKYRAFISYRHADNKEPGRQWATWLHQAIETFEVPADLVGKKNTHGDVIPARIYPVFRDEEDLPADANLGKAIVNALDSSQLLIVLCSPRAAVSTYVANEIDHFKSSGNSDRIIAVIIDGEPNSSWDEGKLDSGFNVENECFPVPLQFEYDALGNRTQNHVEPIAADFRTNHDGTNAQGWTSIEAYRQRLKANSGFSNKAIQEKISTYQRRQHLMLLKIIAGILGVPLRELSQRDKAYQLELEREKAKKLKRWLGAVLLLTMVAVSAGIYAYLKQQEALSNGIIANEQRDKAQSLLNDVRANLDFMNSDLRDVLEKYVPITERASVIERVDRLLERLKAETEITAEDRLAVHMALWNKVDVILKNAEADPTQALPLVKQAHEIISSLLKQDPTNTELQHGFSTSIMRLGGIYLRLGNSEVAFAAYQNSLSIREEMVKNDPGNSGYQRDLSQIQSRIGGVQSRLGNTEEALVAYQASMDIAEALVMHDPSNSQFQRDLSVAYQKLGNIQERMGDTGAALEAFQFGIGIHENLVKLDPDNAQQKWELSKLQGTLGDFYFRRGNADAASTAYQTRQVIVEALIKHDPENTQYLVALSGSHHSLSMVQSELRNYDVAFTALEAGLKIDQDLVNLDPTNTGFQRGLSVSYMNLGDLQLNLHNLQATLKAYKSSSSIFEALASRDPTNLGLQRDLSVSHSRLGDIQLRLGETNAALASYQAVVIVAEALTKRVPTDANYKRNLAVSYDRLGDVQHQIGNMDAALAAYQASLRVRKALVKLDPANIRLQSGLRISYQQIGIFQSSLGNTEAALAAYHAVLSVAEELATNDPLNHHYQYDVYEANIKLGDIQSDIDNNIAALGAYQGALDAAKSLVEIDSLNTNFQWALSWACGVIGDTQRRLTHSDLALSAYKTSIQIYEETVKRDPGIADLEKDLADAYRKIYSLFSDEGRLTDALIYIEKFREKYVWMDANNLLKPVDRASIDVADAIILELNAEIEENTNQMKAASGD